MRLFVFAVFIAGALATCEGIEIKPVDHSCPTNPQIRSGSGCGRGALGCGSREAGCYIGRLALSAALSVPSSR